MINTEGKKILIVEDEPSLLALLAEVFEEKGYTVIKARNGKEGSEVAFAELPDFILSDVLMPKMSGVSMIKELKAREETKDIPVLLLSNLSGDTELVEEMRASFAIGHIGKADSTLVELVSRVEMLGQKIQ